MAATSKIIRVMSCKASHTNCIKVFGGLGGIEFEPNVSLLWSRSTREPLRPETQTHQLIK